MENKANKNLINARARKTKKLAKILQFVPFVSCLILNGSLAEAKSKPASDIDILIITDNDRVFTVRFLVAIITGILGIKRSSKENSNHASKFCFNYYLTRNFLEVPHNRTEEVNIYCAKNYSQSVLVWGEKNIFNEFVETNMAWIKTIINNADTFPLVENYVSRQFPVADIRGKRIGEWWERRLAGRFGNWFELQVKRFQIYLIEKDARTWKYPDYIVYNDRELRFHPPKKKV